MSKTPIKQSSKNDKLCIACAKCPNSPRKIESAKTTHNLQSLLLKYGGINVESGIMCRSCMRRLITIHEKVSSFQELCKQNYRSTVFQSKRLASTPISKNSKIQRQEPETPRNNLKTPTKIPTPLRYSGSQIKERTCRYTTMPQKKETKVRLFEGGLDSLYDFTELPDELSVGMKLEVSTTEQNAENQDGAIRADMDIENVIMKEPQEKQTDTESERERCHTELKKQRGRVPNEVGGKQQLDHAYMKVKKKKKDQTRVQRVYQQPEGHEYIQSGVKPSKFSPIFENLTSFLKEYSKNDVKYLDDTTKLHLIYACASGDISKISEIIFCCDDIRKRIVNMHVIAIHKTISSLGKRKYDQSVLMQKSFDSLKKFNWFNVIDEFKTQFPDLMAQILAVMLKQENNVLYTEMEKVIPRLATIYGIMMQTRNKELSLVQRVNSLLLFDNICDRKVFDRLQRQGVCLGYEGSLYILKIIGGKFNEAIIELVQQRRRFRIVGDNINWAVSVHDQRLDHRGHMEHAFGSAILVQNVDFSALSAERPQRPLEEIGCQSFIPSAADYSIYRRDYTILISKVVFQHLSFFQMFANVVPSLISTPIDEKMRMKTEVIPLPVLYKNEQKLQDVVEILEFYQSTIGEACREAGIRETSLRVHIGGDQLTRERFSSAKSLRAHEDLPANRFASLSPITFEFFHLHMNFLQMVFKTLFKEDSARDNGTLKQMQNLISRSNVGENVNTHYDADKDFFISVVDVYIVEWFMEYFGLASMDGVPSKNAPPDFHSDEDKRSWYFETVGKMLDEHVLTGDRNITEANIVEADGQFFNITLPDGTVLTIQASEKQPELLSKQDGVLNYSKRVLELGLLFKDLLDVTKLPDRSRCLSLLKLTMLFFKTYKNLSKFAYEIIRLLIHQTYVLSEKEASEEFYGMFVNTNGHFDGHIPADRRMEYLVKEIKEHIKHMSSNKTERNIKMRSSAIAGVSRIGEHYDAITNVLIRTQRHSDRSPHGDELRLIDLLREVRPFQYTPGRFHSSFENINPSIIDTLDIPHYQNWITLKKYKYAVELGN